MLARRLVGAPKPYIYPSLRSLLSSSPLLSPAPGEPSLSELRRACCIRTLLHSTAPAPGLAAKDGGNGKYFIWHDGVDAMLQNFALRRNGLSVYEHLEVPEINEPPSPTEPTDLFQIQPEHEDPANVVPMHLLNQTAQEGADLLVVYPNAKVEGTSITALHYRVVVKRFLCDLKISHNRFEGVRHPEEFARLLSRLSRELKSVPSFASVPLLDEFSDPTDYDGCLGELLKDMEDYIKTMAETDEYVYVRRETDTYAQSLLAAATALRGNRSYLVASFSKLFLNMSCSFELVSNYQSIISSAVTKVMRVYLCE